MGEHPGALQREGQTDIPPRWRRAHMDGETRGIARAREDNRVIGARGQQGAERVRGGWNGQGVGDPETERRETEAGGRGARADLSKDAQRAQGRGSRAAAPTCGCGWTGRPAPVLPEAPRLGPGTRRLLDPGPVPNRPRGPAPARPG